MKKGGSSNTHLCSLIRDSCITFETDYRNVYTPKPVYNLYVVAKPV